jgi:ParB-like chromosome segregation protein Spo0J
MKAEQTKLQEKRAAWLAKHPFTPGMSPDEALRLNEELFNCFPLTREEIEQRPKPVDVEFVL